LPQTKQIAGYVALCAGLIFLGVSPSLGGGLLDELFAQAQNHPSVLVAQKNQRASEHDLTAALWLQFPSLSVEAKKKFSTPDQLALQIEQPLWDGGFISNSIKEAKINLDIADLTVQEQILKIKKSIAEGYLNVLKSQELIFISEQNRRSLKRLLETLNLRVEQKISPRSELAIVQARLSQAQSENFRLSGELRKSQEQVTEASGRTIKKAHTLTCKIPLGIVLSDYAWIAETKALILKRLDAEKEKTRNEIEKIKANIFPKFSVGYENVRESGFHSSPSSSVFFSFKYQLSNGLSLFPKIESAGAQLLRSENTIQEQKAILRKEVNSLIAQYISAQNMVSPLQNLIKTNSEQIRSYLKQYSVGRKSWLDVINAQRDFVQAKISLVEAENTCCRAALNLQLLTDIKMVDEEEAKQHEP